MEDGQPRAPQPETDRSSESSTPRTRRKSSFAAAAAKKLQTQTKQREDVAAVPSTASGNVDTQDPHLEAAVEQSPQRSSESATSRPRRKSSFAAAAAKKHMAAQQQAKVDSPLPSDSASQSAEIFESPTEPGDAVEKPGSNFSNRTASRRSSIKELDLLQHHRESANGEEGEESPSETSEHDGAAVGNAIAASPDNDETKDAAIIRRASAFKAQNASQSRRGFRIKEKSRGSSLEVDDDASKFFSSVHADGAEGPAALLQQVCGPVYLSHFGRPRSAQRFAVLSFDHR